MKFCVVDDDPDLLALIGALIRKAGHHAQRFHSSRRALNEIPAMRRAGGAVETRDLT
jgi:FixJ family two-component response regulator